MFSFLRTAGKLNNFVLRQSKIWIKEKNINQSLLLCQCRGIATKEFSNPRTVARLAHKDGMHRSYTLIYRTNLPNYLMFSQIVLSLSMLGLITMVIFSKLEDILGTQDSTDSNSTEEVSVKEKDVKKDVGEKVAEATPASAEDEDLPLPSPQDYYADVIDQNEIRILFVTSLLVLATAMYRLQKIVPVRIYAKQTKHCVAVFYGSIIPGVTTRHEFVAGTVKHLAKPNNPYRECLYKDATGKYLVLMDHFFRYPADLNSLLGKGYEKKIKDNFDDDIDEDYEDTKESKEKKA